MALATTAESHSERLDEETEKQPSHAATGQMADMHGFREKQQRHHTASADRHGSPKSDAVSDVAWAGGQSRPERKVAKEAEEQTASPKRVLIRGQTSRPAACPRSSAGKPMKATRV